MKARTPPPRPFRSLPILPLEPEPLDGLSTEEREAAVGQLAVLLHFGPNIDKAAASNQKPLKLFLKAISGLCDLQIRHRGPEPGQHRRVNPVRLRRSEQRLAEAPAAQGIDHHNLKSGRRQGLVDAPVIAARRLPITTRWTPCCDSQFRKPRKPAGTLA